MRPYRPCPCRRSTRRSWREARAGSAGHSLNDAVAPNAPIIKEVIVLNGRQRDLQDERMPALRREGMLPAGGHLVGVAFLESQKFAIHLHRHSALDDKERF